MVYVVFRSLDTIVSTVTIQVSLPEPSSAAMLFMRMSIQTF